MLIAFIALRSARLASGDRHCDRAFAPVQAGNGQAFCKIGGVDDRDCQQDAAGHQDTRTLLL